MTRIASLMYLYPGNQSEYKKRHDELWPEMVKALKEHGATNYSIFLDSDTDTLFAYLEVEDKNVYEQIAATEICQKWWLSMRPLMQTNPDSSLVTKDLLEVFHLD